MLSSDVRTVSLFDYIVACNICTYNLQSTILDGGLKRIMKKCGLGNTKLGGEKGQINGRLLANR